VIRDRAPVTADAAVGRRRQLGGGIRDRIAAIVVANEPGIDELRDVGNAGLTADERVERIDVAHDP